MNRSTAIVALLTFAMTVSDALALDRTDVIETDGGDITLFVAPDMDGNLRGALRFDLKPGWKTYWRDPGASGIPPSVNPLDTSGTVKSVEILYPVPHWIEASYGDWAGYSEPVSFPLVFETAELPPSGEVALSVFAGICADVCIPVIGNITAHFSMSVSNAKAMMAVNGAFASLPSKPDAALNIAAVEPQADGSLQVAIDTAAAGKLDHDHALFVHAEVPQTGRTISMTRPNPVSVDENHAVYSLAPARPLTADEPIMLHMTVVGAERAVSIDIDTVLKAAK